MIRLVSEKKLPKVRGAIKERWTLKSATIKSQKTRVVIIEVVTTHAAVAPCQHNHQSNSGGAQRAVASICALHFSKPTRIR